MTTTKCASNAPKSPGVPLTITAMTIEIAPTIEAGMSAPRNS